MAFVDTTVDSKLEMLFGSWWAFIDKARSSENNVTGPMHLVSLDRPIHALARRAVTFNDPTIPHQIEVSSFAKVSTYYKALALLCDRVCLAIQRGEITPRDDLLGAPCALPPKPNLKPWHSLEAAIQREDWTTAEELLTGPFANVNDPLFPSLMVSPAEFSAWAVSDGIAAIGEVEGLLANGTVGDAVSSGHPQRPATGTPSIDEIWKAKAKQLADEIYRRDRASACEPSKLAIAAQIEARFLAEGTGGARGRISAQTIVRHGLNRWQKPAK